MEIDPHRLPKQEDVHEFDLEDGGRAVLVELTDENRDDMVIVAISMYLGEKCKYCLREYTTIDDLKDTVWAGCHEYGRLACRSCWEDNND